MACGLAPRAAGSPRSERAGQAGVAHGLAPFVELATLSGCELVTLEIHDFVAGAGNEIPARPWLSRPCAARRAEPPVPLAACLPGRRRVRSHRSGTANCLRGRQRLDAPATADGRARPRLVLAATEVHRYDPVEHIELMPVVRARWSRPFSMRCSLRRRTHAATDQGSGRSARGSRPAANSCG